MNILSASLVFVYRLIVMTKYLLFLGITLICLFSAKLVRAEPSQEISFAFRLPGKIEYIVDYLDIQARTKSIKLRRKHPATILITHSQGIFSRETIDFLILSFHLDRNAADIRMKDFGGGVCGLWERNDSIYRYVIIIDETFDFIDIDACVLSVFDAVLKLAPKGETK